MWHLGLNKKNQTTPASAWVQSWGHGRAGLCICLSFPTPASCSGNSSVHPSSHPSPTQFGSSISQSIHLRRGACLSVSPSPRGASSVHPSFPQWSHLWQSMPPTAPTVLPWPAASAELTLLHYRPGRSILVPSGFLLPDPISSSHGSCFPAWLWAVIPPGPPRVLPAPQWGGAAVGCWELAVSCVCREAMRCPRLAASCAGELLCCAVPGG